MKWSLAEYSFSADLKEYGRREETYFILLAVIIAAIIVNPNATTAQTQNSMQKNANNL